MEAGPQKELRLFSARKTRGQVSNIPPKSVAGHESTTFEKTENKNLLGVAVSRWDGIGYESIRKISKAIDDICVGKDFSGIILCAYVVKDRKKILKHVKWPYGIVNFRSVGWVGGGGGF